MARGYLALLDVFGRQIGNDSSRRPRGCCETGRSQCRAFRIPISGARGFKKAEVTAGGVALEEVDSRTMHSKLMPNLLLAGEVLDLDGPIGGYNFQAAFSTAWLAGGHV